MGQYSHLTLEEREDIMVMRRGAAGVAYRASTAQRRYELRRRACRRRRLLDDPARAGLVMERIAEGRWSPEQVAGRIALERPEMSVSASTIYRAINARELDPPELAGTARGIKARLRHKGKRRHGKGGREERRGKIPGTRPISERPPEAEARERLGDWEGDTVVGKGAGACLVTLVDRTSRLLEGGRSRAHTKKKVAEAQVAALGGHPETRTMTLDRGMEFAAFSEVEQAVGVVTYFAQPHHPWQRGTNENTNGLLREFFPKGTDFDKVTDEEVRAVYDDLNRRPRKCLGFKTPYEVHYSTVLHLL